MSQINVSEHVPVGASMRPAAPSASAGGQLSAAGTLAGIFFEPGRTFESFRQRPRFFLAIALIAVATSLSTFLLYQRLGLENIIRTQIEKKAPHLTEEQKATVIERQTGPTMRALAFIAPAVTVPLVFSIGGALYLLGVLALGRGIKYKQALAVWTYSSFPPFILLMIANTAFLYLQAPEDIDLVNSSGGLLKTNLGAFVSAASHPVLATALSAVDIFAAYGVVLAALGLRKVAGLSAGGAALVAGFFWLFAALARTGMAALTTAAG